MMSNSENQQRPTSKGHVSSEGGPTNLEASKLRWSNARKDLKQAIASWDTLTEQEQIPSSNDIRLKEMRNLLSELKTKLDSLDNI